MVTSGFSRAVSRGTRGYRQRYDQSFAIARGEHSSSLWDRATTGVERKRRRREAAGSSIRSIDVNNTYYYFIWIESSCFSLSLSLFSFLESAEIAGHILLRSRALNFSNFFSQSRLYATSLWPFPSKLITFPIFSASADTRAL